MDLLARCAVYAFCIAVLSNKFSFPFVIQIRLFLYKKSKINLKTNNQEVLASTVKHYKGARILSKITSQQQTRADFGFCII